MELAKQVTNLEISKKLKEMGLLGENKVCKSCLGKKQNSIYKGDKVLQPDFIGDGRYLLEGEGITIVDCSRCKGTGIEPEFIPEAEPQQNEVQELKLLGTDTEDGITCEVRGYWKDGICYVKDVINKRFEDTVQESPSDDNLVEEFIEWYYRNKNKIRDSEEIKRDIIRLLSLRYKICVNDIIDDFLGDSEPFNGNAYIQTRKAQEILKKYLR